MEQPLTAIYDANILYPAPIRDLFIRLAQAGLLYPCSAEVIVNPAALSPLPCPPAEASGRGKRGDLPSTAVE